MGIRIGRLALVVFAVASLGAQRVTSVQAQGTGNPDGGPGSCQKVGPGDGDMGGSGGTSGTLITKPGSVDTRFWIWLSRHVPAQQPGLATRWMQAYSRPVVARPVRKGLHE